MNAMNVWKSTGFRAGALRLLGGSAAVVGLLVAIGAIAQVVSPTPPPTYVTATGTFPTLDDAEAALRNSTAYYGAANQLEHVQTIQMGPSTLRMQYWLRKRPADLVNGPMFYADLGIYGQGKGDCNVPAPDPGSGYNDWCGSEPTLIGSVERTLATKWPGCTITGSSLRTDYSANPSLSGTTASTRGTVSFGFKGMTTTANCTNGTTKSHNWSLQKHKTLYCSTGFYPVSGVVSDATLLSANHCQPRNDDIAWIDTPIRQCGSCAGSRNPIYPATGEKQRHEDDFTFAGRTFTRHYRSLRQFRNNRNFGIGWSHTWSDRVIGTPVTSAPYAHIDESGNYESYALLSGNRYRGENSVGRVLERINANGIGFRLHLPDGEVREFDLDGYLIAMRNPNDPLNDLTIAHADRSIATVTDGQGRVLRFESSANLLRRIVLPDGSAIAYDYDADRNLIRVTYPGSAVRQYHYNEPGLAGAANQRHHLTGITAEDERRYASFSYDARGRATASRVLGTPNELTTIGYPTEDSATMNTAEGGMRAYTIAPGTYRRVLATQEGAATERQTFDAQGRLQSRTDKRNVRTEYAYDGAYVASITSAVGTLEERRQEFTQDPVTGRVTEQRTRDRNGVLVARRQWTYNARGQITASIVHDPGTGGSRAVTTTYCEPADVTAGRCPVVGLTLAVDGPRAGSGDSVTYAYRMADDVACVSSPTTCAYRKGDLWKVTNALGQVVEILRNDGRGRLLSSRDMNGVVTDVEYDPRGRLLARKIRGADDATEYDDQITRIEYEATGAVRRVTMPDGVTTRYEYDAAQRMTGILDSDGNRMRFVFNPAGQRIREDVQDANGALLRTLSRTYDALGYLHQQFDADQNASTYVHDDEGNLTLTTDPSNRKTRHEYDALGRLRSTLEDVDGVAARTQYGYDAMSRINQVIDPNNLTTTYQYDGFGQVVRQESPDTGITRMTYDEAGYLKTRTDARGITSTYSYDALNRVIGVAYPDSSRNVGFVYDTAPAECPAAERFHTGRVARMTDPSRTTLYCYDRFGYPARKLQSTQGRTYTVAYDRAPPSGSSGNGFLLRPRPADGHLYGLTYPDGARIRIGRNAQRQPTAITVTLANGQTQTLLSGAVYYPFGAVSQWTYGNGRVIRRSRNQNYEPGFIEDSGPGGISIGYWFDPAGNLESLRRADQTDPARRKYRYDGLNRLTEVRDGGANSILQAYAYDKTGNRTRRTEGATSEEYVYTAGKHWLDNVAGVARRYDAAGNTTRIGASTQPAPPGGCMGCPEEYPGPGEPGHPGPGEPPPGETQGIASTTSTSAATATIVREFEYDDANRMRAVKHDGVVAMQYLYNAKGERVHRAGSDESVTSLYDEAGRWLGDYDAIGQPMQQVIWMGDLPVGLLVGAGAAQKLYYLQADALGTPRVVIDPVRNVAVWAWDVGGEAFGDSAPNQDADGDGIAFVFDMRFPGQRYDSATGMSYNYFRDYEAATGRYVQSDPIGLNGGPSTFGYVGGNPLRRTDPTGLADPMLELYAAGVLKRMPGRPDPEQPLEQGPPDKTQEIMICSPNCAPGKQRFDTHEEAARNILAQVLDRSREIDNEVCGLICQDNFTGKYFLAKETWWKSTSCPPGYRQCPRCGRPTAWWHTHGAADNFFNPLESEEFSSDDKYISRSTGLPGYLGTPMGYLRFYEVGATDAVHLGPVK
jgi:RHS repeat-associated protein